MLRFDLCLFSPGVAALADSCWEWECFNTNELSVNEWYMWIAHLHLGSYLADQHAHKGRHMNATKLISPLLLCLVTNKTRECCVSFVL